MLSNNDILKKLRVALSLRNEDIIHILSLVDFEITKGARRYVPQRRPPQLQTCRRSDFAKFFKWVDYL